MMTKNEISLIRSLTDRRAREETGLFIAEGRKLAGDLLAGGMRIRKLYYTQGDPLPGVDCEPVSSREIGRLSRLRTPSSLVALVELPGYQLSLPALKDDLVLALDGVQDPGNLGTIVRTADWMGIGDLLCSVDSADCWGPKVVQATMGALARVRVHYGPLEEWLPVVGSPVYGTFLEGEPIYDAPLSKAGVIVMGSEGRGISPAVARAVTHKLFIPPYGRPASESLNVATATAIVCSEFRRRSI